MSNLQQLIEKQRGYFKEELEPISFMVENEFSEQIVVDYDKSMKFLIKSQLELLEGVREVIETNHQKEVNEIMNSNNQESTKKQLLMGIKVYKESLVNSLEIK